jgi:O-antigen ligase/tetratricopeptide (TPR) repeat protein
MRWILIAGVFSIPFIPYIVSSTYYFPFITGKNFTFRIIVEILAGLTFIVALREPEYRPRFSWITVGVLALTAASILSTFTSVDPEKSFWSNFERMEGTIGLLHLTLWFFVTSIVLSAEKLWVRFLQVSILASVGEALYGIFQLLGFATINQGGVRLDGTFGNAIYLAVYMLFHIFFTLYLIVRHKSASYWYWLYGIAVLLQTVALYYTATRSATLGLIGGLFVSGLYIVWAERGRTWVRRGAYVVMGALAVVVLSVFSLRHSDVLPHSETLGRFTSISFSDTTVKARFMIWNMALKGFEDKPVLGWGHENFNFVFNKYYDPRMYAQEQWFDRAHNAYLDWLVAAGIIGFVSFAALFLLAAWSFFRSDTLSPSEKAIWLGLLSAYAFHSFFVFDNLMSSVLFFFLLAFAHELSKKKLPGALWLSEPAGEGLWWGGSAAAAVAVFCGIYFLNMPGMATAGGLIEGLTPNKIVVNAAGQQTAAAKDPQENLAKLSEVGRNNPLGRQEVVEQVLQTGTNVLAAQNVNPQVRDAFVNLAYARGKELLAERPGDTRLELFFGTFLDQAHRFDEARGYLQSAHEHSPNKQAVLFELGINNYLQDSKVPEAVDTLRQAFELEPSYTEARIIYAVVLMTAGKQAEGDKILTDGFGTTIVDDSRLLAAYSQLALYDRMIAIWKLRIEKAPDNIDFQAALALTYKQAGRPAEGLAVLRAIDKKAPQYHEQLVEFAKQQFGQSL